MALKREKSEAEETKTENKKEINLKKNCKNLSHTTSTTHNCLNSWHGSK